MRYLLSIAFLLFSFTAQAVGTRFEDGVDAYQNQDYLQAFAIFLPLAESGNVDAQLSVGTMYDRGQGVEQDSQEALKWYRLAAGQGDEIAKSLIKTMFSSAQGATDYHDDQDTLKDSHGIDNTLEALEGASPVLGTATREETVNQILNKSRLALLNPAEKKQSATIDHPEPLFTQQTYQKIKHWIENSMLYIAEFIGFLLVCFTLFYLFKQRKPQKNKPIFYSYVEETSEDEHKIEEEITQPAIVEEIVENVVHEEPIVFPHQEIDPVPTDFVAEENETEEIDEKEIVEKERLFEYCYNHHAYDEKKLSENPIVKIQRRRYKGSFMEYCYEECYH